LRDGRPVARKITDPGPAQLLDAVESPGTVITLAARDLTTPGATAACAASVTPHAPNAARAAPPKWDRPRGESGWSRNRTQR